ncbi:uncharacterized protein LOC128958116 [Oppia nitens]|uniref:uncharacterized protein LOC128958116 n=1 Tax=Oppia nitens TaxID=1686743 RepID=UPI0023DB1208|nr:uncharacterized protein LOC128958116 [Oppia nitens]
MSYLFLLFGLSFSGLLCQCMGCRCGPLSVAQYYCNSDFAIQITITSERHDTEDELNSWYDMEVVNVYKTSDQLSKAMKSGRIWTTRTSELCGRVFKMDSNYVITGYYDNQNDRLRTHTCTYGRIYLDLNKVDKRFYDQNYKTIDCSKLIN